MKEADIFGIVTKCFTERIKESETEVEKWKGRWDELKRMMRDELNHLNIMEKKSSAQMGEAQDRIESEKNLIMFYLKWMSEIEEGKIIWPIDDNMYDV